jgi:hypothetical protein
VWKRNVDNSPSARSVGLDHERTFDIDDGCLDAGEGFKPPSASMVRQNVKCSESLPAPGKGPYPWARERLGSVLVIAVSMQEHAFLQNAIDMI